MARQEAGEGGGGSGVRRQPCAREGLGTSWGTGAAAVRRRAAGTGPEPMHVGGRARSCAR
jgi:hypothetical protein